MLSHKIITFEQRAKKAQITLLSNEYGVPLSLLMVPGLTHLSELNKYG
jgi:hypothetical protein